RTLMLAIDHGYFQGPTAGLERRGDGGAEDPAGAHKRVAVGQQRQDVHVDALEARGRALEVPVVDREHERAPGGGAEDAGEAVLHAPVERGRALQEEGLLLARHAEVEVLGVLQNVHIRHGGSPSLPRPVPVAWDADDCRKGPRPSTFPDPHPVTGPERPSGMPARAERRTTSGASGTPRVIHEFDMGTVRWICLDADDLMHENTGEENYNESAYYNFYDPTQRLGGFVRIGNRPNEGYAEMTLCLYLPDGTVGFMFGRPRIADNAAFDAGGMRFEVRAPMREHAIRYEGTACLLERPLDLLDPRAAFTQNPHVPARVALDYHALSPAHGGELREQRDGRWVSVRAERAGQEVARGHREQHGRATGSVAVGDRTWTIDGFGLRDRSWGPRYWQAPRYYRWLTMNFGAGAGIAAALTVQRDGSQIQGGYLYADGQPNRPIGRVEVTSDHAGAE